jgi:hypothetical protein
VVTFDHLKRGREREREGRGGEVGKNGRLELYRGGGGGGAGGGGGGGGAGVKICPR